MLSESLPTSLINSPSVSVIGTTSTLAVAKLCFLILAVPPVCDVIVSFMLIVPVTSSNFKTLVLVSKLKILPEAEPEVVKVLPAINVPVISITKKFFINDKVGEGAVS